MPPDSDDVDPDLLDGQVATTQIGAWVVNAETKSALLATALTFLASGTLPRIRVSYAYFPLNSLREWLTFASLLVAAASIITGAAFLVRVLYPRTAPAPTFSRYGWPSLAEKPDRFVPSLCPREQREESWVQAQTLARIAKKKFNLFRAALVSFVIALIGLTIAFLVSP